MHYQGRGTAVDHVRGRMLMEKACKMGHQFEYRAKGINLKGDTQAVTGSNAKPPFRTMSISPYFIVPKIRQGTIEIYAFLWNCGACNVTWVYHAQ